MINILEKFGKSLSKFLFPLLYQVFNLFKINRRAVNYFSEKGFFANNNQNFGDLISSLLNKNKILALDVGAQGGFNSDNFLPEKYNVFFKPILVEPLKEEAEKLRKENEYVIANGLWSKSIKKEINILGNRLGSSSMYQPDPNLFDLHNIKKKDYINYKITNKVEVQCETLADSLNSLSIQKLDYLKIDTQGAELEILKGIGNFRPLIIKIESHIHSMYKEVPNWSELINFLYKLNYIVIDWKGIGSHSTRVPAEMDMVLIPNFNEENGKRIINQNEEKFISLMLIFGQIKLLKIISKKNKFTSLNKILEIKDLYFT